MGSPYYGVKPYGDYGSHRQPIACSKCLAVMPMFERTFPGPIAVSLPQQ